MSYVQPMAVHRTLTDIEEHSLRLNNVLDRTIYNQITVGNVTLPKAVLSIVKIFAVYHDTVHYNRSASSRMWT